MARTDHYMLDEAGQTRWRKLIDEPLLKRWGTYMEAARQLSSRHDQTKNYSDYLRRFARGEPTGLVYMFDEPARLKEVAKLLGMETDALLQLFQTLKHSNTPVQFQMWLPGFSDWGPFPPEQGFVEPSFTRVGSRFVETFLGVESSLKDRLCGGGGLHVIFGPPASGRTTLLRRCWHWLVEAGKRPLFFDGTPPDSEKGDILLVDDLNEQWEEPARRALLTWRASWTTGEEIQQSTSSNPSESKLEPLALVVLDGPDAWPSWLPTPKQTSLSDAFTGVSLNPPDLAAATRLIERLKVLAPETGNLRDRLHSVWEQIDDDAFSELLPFFGGIEPLGWTLRWALENDGRLPPVSAFLQAALTDACRRLQQEGASEQAQAISHHGFQLLINTLRTQLFGWGDVSLRTEALVHEAREQLRHLVSTLRRSEVQALESLLDFATPERILDGLKRAGLLRASERAPRLRHADLLLASVLSDREAPITREALRAIVCQQDRRVVLLSLARSQERHLLTEILELSDREYWLGLHTILHFLVSGVSVPVKDPVMQQKLKEIWYRLVSLLAALAPADKALGDFPELDAHEHPLWLDELGWRQALLLLQKTSVRFELQPPSLDKLKVDVDGLSEALQLPTGRFKDDELDLIRVQTAPLKIRVQDRAFWEVNLRRDGRAERWLFRFGYGGFLLQAAMNSAEGLELMLDPTSRLGRQIIALDLANHKPPILQQLSMKEPEPPTMTLWGSALANLARLAPDKAQHALCWAFLYLIYKQERAPLACGIPDDLKDLISLPASALALEHELDALQAETLELLCSRDTDLRHARSATVQDVRWFEPNRLRKIRLEISHLITAALRELVPLKQKKVVRLSLRQALSIADLQREMPILHHAFTDEERADLFLLYDFGDPHISNSEQNADPAMVHYVAKLLEAAKDPALLWPHPWWKATLDLGFRVGTPEMIREILQRFWFPAFPEPGRDMLPDSSTWPPLFALPSRARQVFWDYHLSSAPDDICWKLIESSPDLLFGQYLTSGMQLWVQGITLTSKSGKEELPIIERLLREILSSATPADPETTEPIVRILLRHHAPSDLLALWLQLSLPLLGRFSDELQATVANAAAQLFGRQDSEAETARDAWLDSSFAIALLAELKPNAKDLWTALAHHDRKRLLERLCEATQAVENTLTSAFKTVADSLGYSFVLQMLDEEGRQRDIALELLVNPATPIQPILRQHLRGLKVPPPTSLQNSLIRHPDVCWVDDLDLAAAGWKTIERRRFWGQITAIAERPELLRLSMLRQLAAGG